MAAALARPPRRRVDGVLLLDKPTALSSNGALQYAKRLYAAQKAGHTGTLDPLASGLLPICFGEATKFAQALLDAPKTYIASVRFGHATATGDADGEVVAESAVSFGLAELERILPRFVGAITQVPPRYAALKFQGRKYYEYARAGVEFPRRQRDVRIDSIRVLAWESPTAALHIVCSKGTYIRTLAEDLAAALGSCAHVSALRRTATGPFVLENATTLDALEAMAAPERDALLLPAHAPLAQMPRLEVDEETARAIWEGRVPPAPTQQSGRYACFDMSERFVGVVEIDGETLRAVRLARVLRTPG